MMPHKDVQLWAPSIQVVNYTTNIAANDIVPLFPTGISEIDTVDVLAVHHHGDAGITDPGNPDPRYWVCYSILVYDDHDPTPPAAQPAPGILLFGDAGYVVNPGPRVALWNVLIDSTPAAGEIGAQFLAHTGRFLCHSRKLFANYANGPIVANHVDIKVYLRPLT